MVPCPATVEGRLDWRATTGLMLERDFGLDLAVFDVDLLETLDTEPLESLLELVCF